MRMGFYKGEPSRYGGGDVYKTAPDGRLSKVGGEKLRPISQYQEGKELQDEAHAWEGIEIGHLSNGGEKLSR